MSMEIDWFTLTYPVQRHSKTAPGFAIELS